MADGRYIPELRRRFSQSDKEDEEEERVDGVAEAKLLNAEKELKKYEKESSIAHVVIKNLEVSGGVERCADV